MICGAIQSPGVNHAVSPGRACSLSHAESDALAVRRGWRSSCTNSPIVERHGRATQAASENRFVMRSGHSNGSQGLCAAFVKTHNAVSGATSHIRPPQARSTASTDSATSAGMSGARYRTSASSVRSTGCGERIVVAAMYAKQADQSRSNPQDFRKAKTSGATTSTMPTPYSHPFKSRSDHHNSFTFSSKTFVDSRATATGSVCECFPSGLNTAMSSTNTIAVGARTAVHCRTLKRTVRRPQSK